jgi:hypothetical protein
MICVVSAVLMAGTMGCRRNDDSIRVQTLEGKVEQIRVNPDGTGEISVLYFSEKQGQEILGTGEVTRDTEILINGAVAKLSDIQVGERVRGEVRIEKKAGEKVQTALKIHVDRPRPVGGD